jgi:CrcB protein
MPLKYLLIAVCGGAGSVARYWASSLITVRWGSRFPWGTLVVNVTGSFLIGLVMSILAARSANANWRLALVVGFLGGYTTFSSFEWETYMHARSGGALVGLANVVCSVVFGYAAVWLGDVVGRR